MARTTALQANALSTQVRLGIILAVVAALLIASQAGTFARERDETLEDPRRQEEPCDRHGENSMDDDPADNGNSMNDDPADNGNSMDDDPADNGNSMNDDPADNGNSMNDDPADTGGKWSEEDDDRPGTITAPIEFDLIAGQSKLPVVKVAVSDLQNAETLASSVPKK